jgi:hypothetical protein
MLGFPFEAMTNATRRTQVMSRVLGFFSPTGTPDLVAASDSGSFSNDDLTNLDNSNSGKRLTFDVPGTVAGATVTIYADGVAIGSAVAAGDTTAVITNGTVDLADGTRAITARETLPGLSESPDSSALSITIDTVAPAAPPAPDLDAVSDSGVNNADNITNDTTPTFTGTFPAPPSAIPLTLYRDGVAVGSTNAGSTWSITTAAQADGTYAFTTTIDDAAGNTSAPSAAVNVTIETVSPTVTGVFVRGTGWSTNFLNFLATSGVGDATLGYRLDAAAHADELPWTNLNQISVKFSEDVTLSTASAFRVFGTNVPEYAGSFTYNPATFTATWTLTAGSFANDKLLLRLDDALVSDVNGNGLDGEWTNPPVGNPGGSDSFPSGDGSAGGDFAFRLNVLPGDVNRSGGVISGTDVTQTRNAQGSPPGGDGSLYTIFKDVNGSASITGTDVTNVRNNQGLSLPAAEPTALP